MKVKYTEPPHCEVKGSCDKLNPDATRMPDCTECLARLSTHTAEVLDFCANDKGAYAILLRDDGRIVALPLRRTEIYIARPETRENGGLPS